MVPQVAGFDWDTANTEKCRSHGVSVGDIEALFERPVGVFPAPGRSVSEQRYKAIGTTQMDDTFFSSSRCGSVPAKC